MLTKNDIIFGFLMFQRSYLPIFSTNGRASAKKERFRCDLVTFSLFREKNAEIEEKQRKSEIPEIFEAK